MTKNKQIFGIEITDIDANGKGIAKVDNKNIIVPNSIPGDIIDLQLTKKNRNYQKARILHTHKYSEKRIQAICQYYGVCGGCNLQVLSYDEQLNTNNSKY